MKKILFLSTIAILSCSCAKGIYEPWAHNNFGAQTTVVLDKANFRVVRNVEAVVEVNNSNLHRRDVEKSAYAELLRNARLTGSQVLTNVVVEEVYRKGFFSNKQFVAARATVIEFIQDNGEPIQSTQPQTPYQPQQTISQENYSTQSISDEISVQDSHEPLIEQNSTTEEYSRYIEQATKLYNRYVDYSGVTRHSNAFLNVIKRTKQNPTAENIADLQCCMTLIKKFGNRTQSSDALEKKLKSIKDKDEQIKIFIEEAKQSAE